MKQLIKLAWRNIWRNRRRTLLTLLAIAFGLGLTVFTRGIQFGTYELTIDYNVSLSAGHVQIHRVGYWDKKTLQNTFGEDKVDLAGIEGLPHVIGASPRLTVDALVAVGDEHASGARIHGVVPGREDAISIVSQNMIAGNWLMDGKNAVIGKVLAKNLRASIGDTLVYFTQGRYGETAAGLFKISGIYSVGEQDMDGYMVFVPLHLLQPQVSAENRLSALVIRVDDHRAVADLAMHLRQLYPSGQWEVMDYEALMPGLMQTIAFDNASGVVFLILLIVVIGFGILETILMSVMERYHEFGVMMALGMGRMRIAGLIFFEALFLGLIGSVLGNVLGYGVNVWFQNHPIHFEGASGDAYQELGFVPKLIALPDVHEQLIWTAVVLGLTIAVAMWPARVAMRFSPVEAIRQV